MKVFSIPASFVRPKVVTIDYWRSDSRLEVVEALLSSLIKATKMDTKCCGANWSQKHNFRNELAKKTSQTNSSE